MSEPKLISREDAPSIVRPDLIRACLSYRDACRLCWSLRLRSRMTFRQLAEEAGLTFQHVTDYFNADDKPTRRDLPGSRLADVERVIGNTAISQWHAMQAGLTVVEELQAMRRAA